MLPLTAPRFLEELTHLIDERQIDEASRIFFINDGSADNTWEQICALAKEDPHFIGASLSRNRGHQNAVLAGLMEARERCDVTISIDCDGQDDIHAMDEMVQKYTEGCEVVYGVRASRETDTFFKRFTAEGFYHFLSAMGVDTVFNHADYRLISSRVLDEFAQFGEVNLFLRGMIPLVGFRSAEVYYARNKRLAGESHYPLSKMLALALDGITSLSIRPIRLVLFLGILLAGFSLVGIAWAIFQAVSGHVVPGWASMTCIICFFGGIQLLSLGIIGEYVGKIYLEVKRRPRYIISERTYEE